ncbi:response regulator [Foetidibacter luteolus]|uniref:response regulator n=1 Tax=Foetidibacter luteolus TaxID=2608880 RepID=UPI00129BAF2C|nr:response regulator transcription factor [Foetidibacter luteolus]
MKNLNILIAEDHVIVRNGLKLTLQNNFSISSIKEVDNLQELLVMVRMHPADLLILDVFLTDGNSVPLLNVIKSHQPQLKVLYFTMLPETIYGKRLISMGASGFLNKQSRIEEIITAFNDVLAGKIYLSPTLTRRLAEESLTKEPLNPFEHLSHREFEIMLMLLEGKQMKEISAELGVQVSTVATYKTRLFEKLNAQSLLDVSKLATAYNVI